MSEEQNQEFEKENPVPRLENIYTIQQGWDDFAGFCYPHIDGVEDLTESELMVRQYAFLAGAKVAMQVHGCGMFFSRCKSSNVINQIHQIVKEVNDRDMRLRLKEALMQILKEVMESKTTEQSSPIKIETPNLYKEPDQCDSATDSSQL